ncbi:SAUR-like auxin-responsive family protein, partial [Escherichia coli]|nr:SAUR-like auxin-responsive family protein [Escherichia coli]
VRESKLGKWVGGGSAFRRIEGPLLASRGYFPICVGTNEDTCRRFMVHTRVLGNADFCELLGKSAEEYGFRNDGVLRIIFEAQDFEEWFIRKSNKKI